MKSHSIAIGAPGGASWERACLGIPNIIIPLADNQRMVCQTLMDNGAAIKVELESLGNDFSPALKHIIENYDVYQQNNLLLCDGLGLYRTIFAIEQVLGKKESSIFLGCRLATNHDIERVYQWQVQPETRSYALNKDIPSWEEHSEWMTNKLTDHENYFYIIEVKNSQCNFKAAGVVRLDKLGESTYLISIFIAPEFHGNGIAQHALTYIDLVHSDLTINATVLSENIASVKLFTRANYKQITAEKFQRTPTL
jgi:RimJ/RimL family protein N-acetyltransferase